MNRKPDPTDEERREAETTMRLMHWAKRQGLADHATMVNVFHEIVKDAGNVMKILARAKPLRLGDESAFNPVATGEAFDPGTPLQNDVAKYLGRHPYDGPENTSRGCAYFYRSMVDKYGVNVVVEAIDREV